MCDPWVSKFDVQKEFGLDVETELPKEKFDAIVLAVAHNEFKGVDFSKLKNKDAVVYDVKNFLPEALKDKTL